MPKGEVRKNSLILTLKDRPFCSSLTKGLTGFTLVETMIVICILGLIIVVALPNFLRVRREASAKLCLVNLKHIEAAKERWSFSSGAALDEEIYITDLVPDFIKLAPLCPSDGEYTLGTITDSPTCSIGTNNTAEIFDDHELLY